MSTCVLETKQFTLSDVPDGISGNWRVESFEIKDDEHLGVFNLRAGWRRARPGQYRRLVCGQELIMSNTDAEIQDSNAFFDECRYLNSHPDLYKYSDKGFKVLINGLGMGCILETILKNDNLLEVVVIEKSEDVIKLVSPYIRDPRVKIRHADALEYKPNKEDYYDVIWHDIWTYICVDNLPDMTKLHKKWGRRCSWQASWCKEEILRLKRRESRYSSWY